MKLRRLLVAVAVVFAIATPALSTATPPPGEANPPNGTVVAVQPVRLVDTRSGQGNRVNVHSNTPLASQTNRCLNIAGPIGTLGRSYIPAGAKGFTAVFTVTSTTSGGFLTVWAEGKPRPHASMVNWEPGETKADWAAVDLDNDRVCVYSGAATPIHFIIDLMSYTA